MFSKTVWVKENMGNTVFFFSPGTIRFSLYYSLLMKISICRGQHSLKTFVYIQGFVYLKEIYYIPVFQRKMANSKFYDQWQTNGSNQCKPGDALLKC